VIETLPHSEAQAEHARCAGVLTSDKIDKKSLLSTMFKEFGARCRELDPVSGDYMVAGIQSYLRNYDRSEKVYDDIEDYITYRCHNSGY
jgi:hypothetical protein